MQLYQQSASDPLSSYHRTIPCYLLNTPDHLARSGYKILPYAKYLISTFPGLSRFKQQFKNPKRKACRLWQLGNRRSMECQASWVFGYAKSRWRSDQNDKSDGEDGTRVRKVGCRFILKAYCLAALRSKTISRQIQLKGQGESWTCPRCNEYCKFSCLLGLFDHLLIYSKAFFQWDWAKGRRPYAGGRQPAIPRFWMALYLHSILWIHSLVDHSW